MAFVEIWNAINTEMLKVKDTDLRVWDVYNYDPKIIWNYPAIIITPTNWNNNIYDTCNDLVTYNYKIVVVDEIQTWIATVEDNMRSLADVVIERLKDVPTSILYIGWNTVKMEFDYQWWRADNQEPQRVFEITAKFTWIKTI